MKPKIHPEFRRVTVTCACGNSFETMSTAKELKVEVCSICHPFFTGQQKFIDTAGRVEKFQAKVDARKAEVEATKQKKSKSKLTSQAVEKAQETQNTQPVTD